MPQSILLLMHRQFVSVGDFVNALSKRGLIQLDK